MRLPIIMLAALLTFASLVRAEEARPNLERTVTGNIEIGPDGRVLDYSLEDDLVPALADALDNSIRGWRFEPIAVDGRPVIAASAMQIDLRLMPRDEGFGFKVANVRFGAPNRSGRMEPPHYPGAAVRAGLGAKVSLVLKLGSDGEVEDVHVEQISLDHRARSENVADHWRQRFARESVEAARRWKFDLTTKLDGEPIGTSVRVPIVYSVSDDAQADGDAWQAFIPGPYTPAPWVEHDEEDALADIAKLGNGEMQPLDSRFHLLGDVVGSLL